MSVENPLDKQDNPPAQDLPPQTNLPEGEKPFEYYFFPDEKQRMLLGKAIEGIIDHVEAVNNTGDKKEDEIPNVIFLDKSARPLSTIFHEIWALKHPDQKQPQASFLNIGREVLKEDPSTGNKYFEITPEIEQEIERIKKQYVYLKEAKPGSMVVIIDDVSHTGWSQKAAIDILSSAFPNLKFDFQFLVEARKKGVRSKDYDKNKPQLFDSEVSTLMGSGEPFITTAPPWKDLGWIGKSPEGVTGVMDDQRPEKERKEFYERNIRDSNYDRHFVEKTSLTAVPYRKHEKYSAEKRAERTKHPEFKKDVQKSFKLAKEAIQSILDLDLKDKERNRYRNPCEELNNYCKTFIEFLANNETDIKKMLMTGVLEKISDKMSLIYKASKFADVPESISKKIGDAWFLIHDAGYNERSMQIENELKIDELVKQLRTEMKQIADEYWTKKNNE